MKRIVTLLLALVCTGCAALPEEERAFAVALGVSGHRGAWTVYARIPTYQSGGGYATVTGEGETLSHALTALDAASPMQLHPGQLRLIVFPAETAGSEEFPALLRELAQWRDLRADAVPAVTQEGMGALMDALKPASGTRLSKALDVLIETRISQGTILPCTLGDLMRMGERQQAALAGVGLEGGDVTLRGCWPMDAQGRVHEAFTAEETQLLALMLGQMKRGSLSLPEGVLRLTHAEAQTELAEKGFTHADVRLTLHGTQLPLAEEALEQSVAQACLGILNRLAGMGSDLLGLGRQAMGRVGDMDGWRGLQWPLRYGEIQWRVWVGITGEVGT